MAGKAGAKPKTSADYPELHGGPAPVASPPPPPAPSDYLTEAIGKGRIRLAGIIQGKRDGVDRVWATVEIIDASHHVIEIFDLASIEALGWKYHVTDYGLLLTKEKFKDILVRPFPLDYSTRVAQRDIERARSAGNAERSESLPALPGLPRDFDITRIKGTSG